MEQNTDSIIKNKETSDVLTRIIKVIFFIIFGIVILGLFYFSTFDRANPISSDEPVYIDRWTVTDPNGVTSVQGNEIRTSMITDKSFTGVSVLPEDIKDDSLFVVSVSGDISVYIDGELRKDFIQDRDVKIPGGCVKRFYMLTPVSSADSGKEIKIIRTGTTRRGHVFQDAFVVARAGLFPILMKRFGMPLMLTELLFILALLIVIISIAMRFLYKQTIEMLYGSFAVLIIAGWVVTNSYLFPFIYGHFHIDGIMNYMFCLMMPFNLLFYLDALQKGRYRKITNVVLYASAVNMIIWPTLNFTGIYSFPNALIFINIFLGIQILVVAGMLVADAVRGKIREYNYTAIGFVGFLICGFLELLVLNFFTTLHDEIPMLIGLAFFLTMLVVQQMSSIKRMRDERQHAVDISAAKTKFLASMSHEIRTPINSILGMNEMILRENNDPVIADYARSVKSSGKMLVMLVNDVLDFSKIEAGKLEITPVEFTFSSLLRDIMPMLTERAEGKQLYLKTKLLAEIPDGMISDELRIKQVLINLINNAIKYTDVGGVTLAIGGMYNEDNTFALRLTVRDSGRGITEEDQAHLFEAFTRADLTKNGNIEGTGLGLAIVKNILDSMQGSIEIESKYGEGSEFIITLPVEVYDSKPMKENFMERTKKANASEDESDYVAPEAQVLAVDDNAANLKIVSLFLKRVGIVPDNCDSGKKAVELAKKKSYDLILLDHMMPEMDGIEALAEIRSNPDSLNRKTTAVVLTANAVAGSRQTYMDAGFADYLTKPILPGLLEQTVKKFLPKEKVHPVKSANASAEQGAFGDVEAQPVKKKQSIRERLSVIEGLDYEKALNYTADSEEVLEQYVDGVIDCCDEKIAILKSSFASKDFARYSLEAHSIKGMMATLGITSMSDRAKHHEFAGKDEDADFISRDCDAFCEAYRKLCDKLRGRV